MLGLQETRPAGSPTTKTYSCVACSATFQSLASLLVHQASHANEISSQPESTLPTCDNCGGLFANADLLEKHHCTALHTPASQVMHMCDCGEEFDALSALEEHKQLHKPDAQVRLSLDSNPEHLQMMPMSKTDSSHPISGQSSNEEPVKSALDADIEEMVSTTDSSIPVENNDIKMTFTTDASNPEEKDDIEMASTTDASIPGEKSDIEMATTTDTSVPGKKGDIEMATTTDTSIPGEKDGINEQDQDVLKPLSHTVTEEQEPVLEKNSNTLEPSSTSNHSVHDSEKSTNLHKESTTCKGKSILKMLASAYMSHRQPSYIKPEQSKRNLPPRKVSPRAPMQTAAAITVSKPKPPENQPKTKSTEKVVWSSDTAVNVKTGKMSSKKGKVISVTQTLYPVVMLETRQKLFGKDNIEGRHKCGVCRRVFQDADSLIMHHAQHKKERVKFCLCCQQFVICVAENHTCSFGVNRQSLPTVENKPLTLNRPTTATRMQRLFHCSSCNRSYIWKRNLKRHNLKGPCTPLFQSSDSVSKQDNVELCVSKNDCNRAPQDSKINKTSIHHVNVGVGTNAIKIEEQGIEVSKEGNNQAPLNSASLMPGDQLHSSKPFESVNSTSTKSSKAEKTVELPASMDKVEAEDEDKFEEKQWIMPLDDAEIDVLIDADQDDMDNEDNLENMPKQDHDDVDDDDDDEDDVVIVDPPDDKEMSLLPSSGFHEHVSDEGIKRFVCAGCQRSYSRRFTLLQHLRICGASKLKQQNQQKLSGVPGPIKRFPCPQCGKFFSRKDNMNIHRRKCQAKIANPPTVPKIVENKTQAAQENLFVLSPSTETPAVRQETSRNSSSNWGIMSLPSVLPRRVTCECGAFFTCPRLLFEHLQLHAQESYICPHCGENLQSWMDFEAHQHLHGQSQSQASEQRGLQLHSYSFSQVTQSHVPAMQQPRSFSQMLQTHIPTGPQQAPGFQAPELQFKVQPSTFLPPQNLNHKPNPEPVSCHRCKKTFAGRRSLLRHLRLSCRGDAVGERKQLPNISNTSKPTFKPLRCPVCVRWFSCLDGLKRHLVLHSKQTNFSCQLCGENCPSEQALEEHKKNVHEVNSGIVSVNVKQEDLRPAGEQSGPSTNFQCHICLRCYPKLQSLKDHLRKIHRPKEVKPTNIDSIHPGQFQCQICMRTYPDIRSLKNHRRRVHHILGGVFQPPKLTEQNRTPGQFQCQICSCTFADISSLQNHRRRVHRILGGLELMKDNTQQSQLDLYKCNFCQRSYPDLVSLKNHRRRVHRILGPVPETTTIPTTNDTIQVLQQSLSDSQSYM